MWRCALADASMVVRRCLPYSTYRILSTRCARPDVYEPAFNGPGNKLKRAFEACVLLHQLLHVIK